MDLNKKTTKFVRIKIITCIEGKEFSPLINVRYECDCNKGHANFIGYRMYLVSFHQSDVLYTAKVPFLWVIFTNKDYVPLQSFQ